VQGLGAAMVRTRLGMLRMESSPDRVGLLKMTVMPLDKAATGDQKQEAPKLSQSPNGSTIPTFLAQYAISQI
jgi:hypothetical protein